MFFKKYFCKDYLKETFVGELDFFSPSWILYCSIFPKEFKLANVFLGYASQTKLLKLLKLKNPSYFV